MSDLVPYEESTGLEGLTPRQVTNYIVVPQGTSQGDLKKHQGTAGVITSDVYEVWLDEKPQMVVPIGITKAVVALFPYSSAPLDEKGNKKVVAARTWDLEDQTQEILQISNRRKVAERVMEFEGQPCKVMEEINIALLFLNRYWEGLPSGAVVKHRSLGWKHGQSLIDSCFRRRMKLSTMKTIRGEEVSPGDETQLVSRIPMWMNVFSMSVGVEKASNGNEVNVIKYADPKENKWIDPDLFDMCRHLHMTFVERRREIEEEAAAADTEPTASDVA